MCLICIELEKQRLSLTEASLALNEMRSTIGEEHAREVEHKLDGIRKLQATASGASSGPAAAGGDADAEPPAND